MKLVNEKSVLVDPLSEDTVEGVATSTFCMLIMSRQDWMKWFQGGKEAQWKGVVPRLT